MPRYRQTMREALQEVVSENETFDEAMKWEVKIAGLPTFYSDGKSRGQVRQALRKMLKRPDDIQSIERTTPAALKKIRRDQAKGEGGEEVTKEGVEDAYDYKAKKGAIAAPGSGSIAKAKKAKASDVNKSIEQQMKDALKEHIKDSIKEKSTVDADGVVNMIQFGHPFKVVDEEIPPELPGPETRRYANVSNAVVDKADKKSNKAMAKAQKDTLVPTQTKEEVVIEQEGGVTDDSGYTRYPSTGNWAGIKGKTYKKNLEIAKAKIKAQVKDKKNQNKDPVGKVKEEVVDENGDHPPKGRHQHPGQKKGSAKLKKGWGMTQSGEPYFKPSSNRPTRDKKEEIEIDEILKWKVDVKGNPPAYMDGKSAAAVRQRERRIVKRPKDIGSVTRVTPAEYRKTLRQAAAGKVDLTQVPEEAEGDYLLYPMHKNVWRGPKTGQKKQPAKKKVSEVAPPGWGHTKAEKEKTKPDKPKSKIGGSAHEFDKDLKSGKFKGLPGDKTYKDKKASMFKLMWSMKNKGDKPHYKPGVKDKLKSQYKEEVEESKLPPHLSKFFDKKGDMKPDVAKRVAAGRKKREAAAKVTDVTPKGYGPNEAFGLPPSTVADKDLGDKINREHEKEKKRRAAIDAKKIAAGKKLPYKKEENLLDSAKRYLNEKADWNTAFKSAAQSRPPMKYKDAVSFIDTAGLNSTEKRSALKAAKKWLR